MRPQTHRQREILTFIRAHIEAHGFPPTRTEIASRFGFNVNAAQNHLRALATQGLIALEGGRARGIRLPDPTPEREKGLPVLGRVAAGTPIAAQGNVDSRLDIQPELFHPRADFLLRVAGDSMRDGGILDGDIVGVHIQRHAENGQIVLARIPDMASGDDQVTLKRFYREGGRVSLRSENKDRAYAPIQFDLALLADESQEAPPVSIEGIFVGLIRFP